MSTSCATRPTYRDFLRQATEDEKTYFVFSGIRNPLDVAVPATSTSRAT